MKTSLKLKLASLIVIEQPLLTATIVVFFSAVIMMALLAVFQSYELILKVAQYAFWTLAVLAVAHFAITKLFVTRFFRKKNRIPLLFYDSDSKIYQHPVFKKLPYAEIIFPDHWNVEHIIGKRTAPILLRVETSDTVNFLLAFDLNMEMVGHFQAKGLEDLISSQKVKFPNRKKFEFIDCLEDFLVADILRNHHSIKYLLEDYHLRQINLKSLEDGILQMVKIPKLFANVTETKLKLTDVRRVVRLNPNIQSSLKKAAAAVL